jgi:glucose-6-phosphate dehydrogenase assembly protein OpcA
VSLDVHPVADALAKARTDAQSMKASTMTLAIFLDDDAAHWIRDRAHALAEKYPSRVVLFDATKTENENVVEPALARSEWIEIGARDADAEDLSAALLQLELPEAPVVLLWLAQTFTADTRFLALAQRARATICSSSAVRSDPVPLRDLTVFVERHPEIVINDVAYLRLGTWRELIAEFFDEPECLRELQALRSVEVTAGSDAEMYYLLGWLASRLAWTPAQAGVFGTSWGDVQFAMLRDGPPRRISKVVLRSDGVTFTASVHPTDAGTICLDVSGPTGCGSRCTPLHTMDLASLIERAILNRSHDQVFIESLAMARAIIDRQRT